MKPIEDLNFLAANTNEEQFQCLILLYKDVVNFSKITLKSIK